MPGPGMGPFPRGWKTSAVAKALEAEADLKGRELGWPLNGVCV